MLDPCQSTKGRLVTLDLGLVFGVPILEAPPSLFWDILNHSMKDYIDPSWLRSCGGLGWCCASCLHSSGFICINLHLSATRLHLSALVCTYRQLVCTYRQIVCTYRHYCGIFWKHVGSLSVDKGASCNTRFGACFWGTYFGGSSQSILGHPEPFYEGLYRPLLAQVLWWPWMVLRFLFAFIWIHLH